MRVTIMHRQILTAWATGDSGVRVRRGGSWVNVPRVLRAACRSGDGAANRYSIAGFRVARTF